MIHTYFNNKNEEKTPTQIIQEAHERIYQNYMKQREKEQLRAWITEEIKKQATAEIEKIFKDIFK